MATDKQSAFIRSLAEQKQLDIDVRLRLLTLLDGGNLAVGQASDTINWLLKQPSKATAYRSDPRGNILSLNQPVRAEQPAQRLVEVPTEGRYAVEHEGVLKFFVVDHVTDEQSRWFGRTFLSIQASDDKFPVKNPATRSEVYALILKDPKGAMLRYGLELGHCGHCGRTLTNEESRNIGIGPVCRAKMGW